MTAVTNDSLRLHFPEAEPAMCPAHPYQHLGLFDQYLPTLEQLLSQARRAAKTYVGGEWVVDDAKVLECVYESLVSERRVLKDAFAHIYGVSFVDDAHYLVLAELHRVVAVGLTTGYVASSLAIAPLPIAQLLYDKAYYNGDKLYFSRFGARVAITDQSSRAQNFAARDVAESAIRHRLGQGDGDVVGGVGDAMEEDADDVRRRLELLRGERAIDENLWYGASASDELFRPFVPGYPQNSSPHRLDFKGLNQFFGEVTAMQLKRDRVRAHVWGRVTARFNAIAENCAGVWKL